MSNTPQTIKHNNRSKNRDFNIYTEEYFGGSDAFIYINGKRWDNVAHIQYSIQEQHKPIYGYGSRTFDDLAVGNRIVVGAIKIPVKNIDESNFGQQYGIETQRLSAFTEPINVPQWVYNYKPEKSNNTVVVKNEGKEEFSTVANIQKRLGLEPNGFIDEDTRSTIHKYRKSNGMILGTLIDNELISSLGIEDYNCYALKPTKLYDSPTKDITMADIRTNEKLIFLASDDEMAMVRRLDGLAGYINVKDVYRK